MAKRKNGEGSYGDIKINGKTYKRYRDKEIGTVYASSAKELKEKIAGKRQNLEHSIIEKKLDIDRLSTFADLCDKWLPTVYNDVAHRTYDDYESIIKSRIKNYKKFSIGNEQISSIKPFMFTNFFTAMGKNYAAASIHKTHVICTMVVKYGIKKGYISKDFDFEEMKEPHEDNIAVGKKEIKAITMEDMELLYKELKTPRYGEAARMLIFIMYSGLRVNEAIALKWNQVSADYKQIKILASNSRIVVRDEHLNPVRNEDGTTKHEIIRKGPKSKDGYRTIPLPPRAIEVLKNARKIDSQYNDDHVFLSQNGTPFTADNARRCLKCALAHSKCDYKKYTPHALRHGYGSVLIANGVDIKIVSELLGHSNVAFTYNVYIEVLDKNKISAINTVFGIS